MVDHAPQRGAQTMGRIGVEGFEPVQQFKINAADAVAQGQHAADGVGRWRRHAGAEAARGDRLVATGRQQRGTQLNHTAAHAFGFKHLGEFVQVDAQLAADGTGRRQVALHAALEGEFEQLPRMGGPAVLDEDLAARRLGIQQPVIHRGGGQPRRRHDLGAADREGQHPRRRTFEGTEIMHRVTRRGLGHAVAGGKQQRSGGEGAGG